MKTNKTKFLISALISFSISILLNSPIFAADIQFEGYIEGGLTLNMNGAWENINGISHNQVLYNQNENQSAFWTSNPLTDYITYTDDTSTTGFQITISITDFNYTGSSTNQAPLNSSNFTLYGKYDTNGANVITKGYNDPIYNLSILPNSCTNATPSNFTFHNNFSDPTQNFSLNLLNSDQTILESNVDCLNIGHIRFDRTEILIPANSKIGNYSATITTTITDGNT